MANSFHLVSDSTFDLELYERLDFVKQNKNSLERLRTLLSFIKPQNYKGIGRATFSADPFYLSKATGEIITWADTTKSLNENKAAKFKLLEIEKEQKDDTRINFYFDNIIEVNSVFELLDDKSKFEKIETILDQMEMLPGSYGFDIGYWCGDFSIIADTAIKPTWHPPDLDDMYDVVLQLKKLNQFCLFDTYNDALDYKEIYLSKKWAEENWYENDNDKEGDIKIVLVRPCLSHEFPANVS
jgi:hypothetical protein